MIPVVGNVATAGKWVNKGAKAAKGISEGFQNANKGLVGRVTGKSQQASRERKKTGTIKSSRSKTATASAGSTVNGVSRCESRAHRGRGDSWRKHIILESEAI